MPQKRFTEDEVLRALRYGNERRQKEVLAHYLTAARMIPLRIDIWHNLERVFFAGVADAEEVERCGYTSREKELYAEILEKIPMFVPIIEACARVPSQVFKTFIKLVCESAAKSRGCDMQTVKAKLDLLCAPEFRQLNLAISTKKGWNDRRCTSLLIPPRYREEFFNYPLTFMAKVQSSQIKIKASEFPAFLYADASKFDPKKPHRGLLKGPLLVRVFRCIFTGRNTAMRKDARTSNTQAMIHKISTVEPFGIVYAAVLTRQALSSAKWGAKDLHFDYRIFTNQLMGLFKDLMNPWVQNLLDWWNNQVLFKKASEQGFEDIIEDSSDDENIISVDDLLALAAKYPDSDSDVEIISDEETGLTGAPLSRAQASQQRSRNDVHPLPKSSLPSPQNLNGKRPRTEAHEANSIKPLPRLMKKPRCSAKGCGL